MTTWLLPPKSGATFTTATRNVIVATLGVPVPFDDEDVNDAVAQGWEFSNKAPVEKLGKLLPVDAIFIPETDDYNGILAAYNLALDAGGGTVKLRPVTYNLGGNSLPMAGGVWYEGAGWSVSQATGLVTGTVMVGDGTAPAFWDGKTDNAVPFPTNPEFSADRTVFGGGITKMGFSNFTYGIKSGALYRGGVELYTVDDVIFDNCNQWCVWFENSSYSRFKNFYVRNDGYVNGLFFGCSSGAVYNNTNNHYENITMDTISSTIKSRQIFMGTRAANTAVNDTVMYNVQVNTAVNELAVNGTPVGGASVDISVPDSSLLAIDMPVVVKTTVNGLNAYVTYFVTYATGNIIRLANNPGGTNITFAATTVLPLFCYGFPHIDFSTSFEGSSLTGCQIQPFTLHGLDLEGGATTSVLVVSGTGNIQQGTSNGQSQGTAIATQYCFRSSQVQLTNVATALYDFDAVSATGSLVIGAIHDNTTNSPFPNSTPQGLIRSFGRGALLLNLCTRGLGANARIEGLQGVNPSGGNFIYPHGSIGQDVQVSTSTSLSMFGAHLGCIAFTGTANATWTLPTLAGALAVNSYFGGVFEIANASTTGGVVLTLNSAAGQGFNRQAKTSYSLALGTSITVRAMIDGSNFWWHVVGNNGAV